MRYEPSPPQVVSAMLDLAAVTEKDVVYDLGCGDGRIVIEAAKRYGARGVCVDIDPRRIAEARANAAAAGVVQRIEFREEDLMRSDLREATVVTLFLSYDLNLALRPKLERELAAGTRVVSHWHRMGDWPAVKTVHVEGPEPGNQVFLFRTPGSSRGIE
ncbi:MAG TPA: class I SAM-dependent methyltransferase [Burkholderiales bacterium]|nr:class I SAM-dependent methyltransferase [Burkholderiales bacterium]